MGLLEFIKKLIRRPETKKGEPEPDRPVPAAPETDKPELPRTGESISLSISKETGSEQTVSESGDSISGEVILKGDLVLETYKVLSDAITGGMGSVWKVHHSSWNTDLAMKRPKPRFFAEGSEERKEKFIHECKVWIDLGLHPNIVSCYYVREIGGVPSIFSEWMENGDLERHIKDGTLYEGSAEEVQERLLDIAIQSARGLRYAHENNLVHQDVKPANILLSAGWEAKVCDFGIARARSALSREGEEAPQPDTDPAATVITPGGGRTPAYCSPEQAADLPLTQRTDIYSWAVSVMEMYLGGKPWTRSGQAAERDRDPGPQAGAGCRQYLDLCTERPVPEALKELLAQCMEEDPGRRPKDFGVIEAALLDIYRETAGRDYPRRAPQAASDTPDSLNNKALSYLDMGQAQRSRECWQEALAKDPGHMASLYNYALFLWRAAEIDDLQALHMLQLHESEPDYARFAARLELERGNPEAVSENAGEDEQNAAQQLPALETQTCFLDQTEIDEHPFIEISPDGDLILCGDKGAMLYSAFFGKPYWTDPGMELQPGTSVFWGGPWNDARLCLRNGEHLEIYELTDKHLIGTIYPKCELRNFVFSHFKDYARVYAGTFTRDAYHMLLADTDDHNRVFLREEEILSLPFDMRDRHIRVLFPKKGGFVLYCHTQHEDPEVTYFDEDTWKPASRFRMDYPRRHLALSADDHGIWGLAGDKVYLYDLETGDILRDFPYLDYNTALSACSGSVLTAVYTMAGENYVRLWNPDTGRCMRSIPIPGRCFNDALAAGDTRIALLGYMPSSSGEKPALITMRKPSFAYSARWELTRIHTASEQIGLEERFIRFLADARKDLQAQNPEEALSKAEQAMRLSDSMRSDPRARALLHEIRALGTKVKLRGVQLVRTVRANTEELGFTPDSKQLYISEKLSRKEMHKLLLDLDSGEVKDAWALKIRRSPARAARDAREEAVAAVLPNRRDEYRAECDISADGCCAAAVDWAEDTSTGNHLKKELLRVWSLKGSGAGGEDGAAIREVQLPLLSSRQIFCDRLRFMKDSRTFLLILQKPESTGSRLLLTFSLWDAPEMRQIKAFDVSVEAKTEHSRRTIAPDEIGMSVRNLSVSPDDGSVLLEIRSLMEDHYEYRYIMADLATGEAADALPHPVMRLGDRHAGTAAYSKKLQFTGAGRQIAYIKDPSTVAFTPLQEGEEETEISGDFNIPADMAVSPDGLFLAVAGGEEREEVYVYELDWEMQYDDADPGEGPEK